MELDRLNSPTMSAITLEVLGHQLLFSQDPNSGHLGTTVQDASMVFVKFLAGLGCSMIHGRKIASYWERFTIFVLCLCHVLIIWFRKVFDFSPSKLKGKHVIELGAGCGVVGFDSIGSIEVAELAYGRQVGKNGAYKGQCWSAAYSSHLLIQDDWCWMH